MYTKRLSWDELEKGLNFYERQLKDVQTLEEQKVSRVFYRELWAEIGRRAGDDHLADLKSATIESNFLVKSHAS